MSSNIFPDFFKLSPLNLIEKKMIGHVQVSQDTVTSDIQAGGNMRLNIGISESEEMSTYSNQALEFFLCP